MSNNKFLPKFLKFLASISDRPKTFSYRMMYQSVYQSPLDSRFINRGLKNLEARGIIKPIGDNYLFTNRGHAWLKNSDYIYFRLRNHKWDKKWYIILFDIPLEMEKQRQIFRRRLKRIGCYLIQKSVFVFPYPCHEEIGEWCQELELTDYIDIILADSVGSKEIEIKKYFNL